MTEYRYTIRTIYLDYVRAGFGLVVTVVPMLFVPTAKPVSWALLFLLFIFVVYAGNVIIRHASVIEIRETGIRVSGPLSRSIRWQELEEIRLGYFSTRRDGTNGWLQLVLEGAGVKIRIESTLVGFTDIVRNASEVANDQGLNLSVTTRRNLELLVQKKELLTSGSISR